MSDALTDIARDERRARNVNNFLRGLIDYLQGNLNEEEVIRRAKIASGGRHGYFSGPVDLVTGLDKELKQLKRGTQKTWAKALFRYRNSDIFFHILCHLSPWKLSKIVCVDYGMGFARVIRYPEDFLIKEGDINKAISEKDWITYDCDDYLVVFYSDNSRKVFWIGNSTGYQCKDNVYRWLERPRKRSEWTGSGTMEQREKYCR